MDGPPPTAITPHYRTPAVNEPVPLATGPLIMRHGNRCEPLPEGAAKFAWLPLPGVVATAAWSGVHSPEVRIEGSTVSLDASFAITRVGSSGVRAESDGLVYIHRSTSRSPALCQADLHVLNLPRVVGNAVRDGNNGLAMERQSWRFGVWTMTMDPLFVPKHLVDRAKEVRGNLLTHVVRVTRTDGAPFDAAQLGQVIDDLHLTLSFVFGDDIGAVLAAGRDESGDVVLELLCPYPCDGWRPRSGPAPRESGISEMMTALGTLLNRPTDGVREAIVYYLEACYGMVESTVLLALASMDRLADHCLVGTRKLLTEAEYDDKKRSVAQNVREAMQTLEIPTTVEGQEMDLPALIASSRNRVHVRPRAKRVEPVAIYLQALQTAELMVLALAGYRGLYHPRGARRAADEILVPWAK